MHANREDWLTAAVGELRSLYDTIGHPLPAQIRLACGFTSAGRRTNKLAECWSPDASADGTTEILISPTIADAPRVLDILLHELIHAAGISGHGAAFAAPAAALGLVGPWKSTTAGPDFTERYGALLDALGPYPHAPLGSAGKPAAPTYLLKAACPQCGYTVRVTAKWTALGLPYCPVDGQQFTLA